MQNILKMRFDENAQNNKNFQNRIETYMDKEITDFVIKTQSLEEKISELAIAAVK